MRFCFENYLQILPRYVILITVIFGYNGRDGVVTDRNGLIYMRARYYSPEMKRFINADIIPGKLSNAITLNRFAYANGNPVSFVDPFGLSAERGGCCEFDYLLIGSLSPWGNPNTHVTKYEGYWKERWYGPDGKAVRDRHWSDHGFPKYHTDPHEQEWDWSDPEHPQLPNDSNPPADPPDPPTSEGEEPWYPEDSKDSSEDENNDNSNQASSVGDIMLGIGIVVVASVSIAWLVGNDVSGVGVADNAAIIPAVVFF